MKRYSQSGHITSRVLISQLARPRLDQHQHACLPISRHTQDQEPDQHTKALSRSIEGIKIHHIHGHRAHERRRLCMSVNYH
jgi:hypothetical protein